MDGFIVVDKEKGMTSQDVCSKLKKILNTPHVGHTGTLDPNTTGVLVCAIGKATKLMPLLLEHTKEYQTTVMLGVTSDTLDITGNLIEGIKPSITEDLLDEKLNILKEAKMQLPPMYSSIKVNGRKLYEYARKGQEIKVDPRPINIYELKRTSPIYEIDGHIAFDLYMKVSKGFYVRSLCRDIAQMLNTCGLMYSLDRISSGDFTKEMSHKLDENISSYIISIEDVFKSLEKLNVNDYMAKLVSNGVMLDERQITTDKPFKVYNKNKLIAIYEVKEPNKYKPVVLFKEEG